MNTVFCWLFVRMVAQYKTPEVIRCLVKIPPSNRIFQYNTIIFDLSNVSSLAARVPVSRIVPDGLQNRKSTSRKRLLHEDEQPSKKPKYQENAQLDARLEKLKKDTGSLAQRNGQLAAELEELKKDTGSLAKSICKLLEEEKALKAENHALRERLKAAKAKFNLGTIN